MPDLADVSHAHPEFGFPDTDTRDSTYAQALTARHAYARVPVVLDPDQLAGPVTGLVEMPAHIAARAGLRPGAPVDLDDERTKIAVYEQTLRHGDAQTIATVVNHGELVRLWPRLQLPTTVRDAWTTRLTATGLSDGGR